jgi:hypothetical protein
MEEGGISNGESIEFIDWQFSSLLFGYTQRASHWTLVEAVRDGYSDQDCHDADP